MIVRRLKQIMCGIVAPTQSSFVPRRQITDNIVITKEVMHSMKAKSEEGLSFHGMVVYTRYSYGSLLTNELIGVITEGVTSFSMRVLWNGGLGEKFRPSRGVRHGDPLSSYLFVLVMECLGHIIDAVVEAGAWKPICLANEGPKLSHLFFADDLVLFAKAFGEQMRVIQFCLEKFCKASRAKINFQKSRVCFLRGVDRNVARHISIQSGIPITEDLGNYLGMLMPIWKAGTGAYQHILDRVSSKLVGWRSRLLSMAGKGDSCEVCCCNDLVLFYANDRSSQADL